MSNKVNTMFCLGLIAALGISSLLILQAKSLSVSVDAAAAQPSVTVQPGVKLKFQVDKAIYRNTETVLSALRNDSRKMVWIMEHADGCAGSWWNLERLTSDGETWQAIALSKQKCDQPSYGQQALARHTVLTSEWNMRVPGLQLGDVVVPAGTGTYRLVAPYLVTTSQPKTADWTGDNLRHVYSQTFTIQ